MARKSSAKASSSSVTAQPRHIYTPLGPPTTQDPSPKLWWKSFKRVPLRDGSRLSTLQEPENDEDDPMEGSSSGTAHKETYNVGDVVMVRHTQLLPVVGIITQMWTMPDDDDDSESEEDDDDEDDFVPMWCKIRFLYWPDELTRATKTRLKGLIGSNEIFYTHRLPRFVPSSRTSNRSQAAAEAFAGDDFQSGHSVLESDGFTVSDILGHAYIHSSPSAATQAAKEDKQNLLHKGKAVVRHLYCSKAVDPMKELFWSIDYSTLAERGRAGKGWDLVVEEDKLKGRSLAEWADEEKKRAKKEGRAIVEVEEEDRKTGKSRSGRTTKKPATYKKKQIRRAEDSSSSSSDDSSSEDEAGLAPGDADYVRTSKKSSNAGRKRRRGAKDSDEDSSSSIASSDEEEEEEEDDFEFYDDDEDEGIKRKRPTSRGKKIGIAQPTPRSRRIIDLRKEARQSMNERNQAASSGAFLPDPSSSLPSQFSSLEDLQSMTAPERAKRLLHVSTTPSKLPCRQTQAENLLCLLEDSLDTGIGSCIYISGVPGTGKTATVRGVISLLQQRSEKGQVNPFDFLEINGMKVADAGEAYSMLWSVVGDRSGDGGGEVRRRSPKAALGLLSKHYSSDKRSHNGISLGPGRAATIVLMDELDQLLTSRQDVMYNLFNWPSSRNSRLIVVAVANTMDLPERTMSAKVASRLGMTRITFMPYNDRELGEIVRSRLGMGATNAAAVDSQEDESQGAFEGDVNEDEEQDEATASALTQAKEDRLAKKALTQAAVAGCDAIFVNDAITYAAKRISNVSGDARRMLDVCRRALESVEAKQQRTAVEGEAGQSQAKVTISDIRSVLDGMVKSSRPSHIARSLSLHGKVLLLSLLHLLRKTGLTEINLADLIGHHLALCRLHSIFSTSSSNSNVLSLPNLATTALNTLSQLGLIIIVGNGLGPGKAMGFGRVMMAVREDEVRLALEGDEDQRIRGMLN